MRIEIENSVFRVWRARHTLIASIDSRLRVGYMSAPSDSAAHTPRRTRV